MTVKTARRNMIERWLKGIWPDYGLSNVSVHEMFETTSKYQDTAVGRRRNYLSLNDIIYQRNVQFLFKMSLKASYMTSTVHTASCLRPDSSSGNFFRQRFKRLKPICLIGGSVLKYPISGSVFNRGSKL